MLQGGCDKSTSSPVSALTWRPSNQNINRPSSFAFGDIIACIVNCFWSKREVAYVQCADWPSSLAASTLASVFVGRKRVSDG